ncbi:MAG: hypothetical protein V2I43_00220 [Parvularcula sp.]|jgi:multidrug transporter EmrE-like cation transporter|nr:hypothetical protein [Parvularcula sp.]
MIGWIFVALAVAANVATNFFLKKAATTLSGYGGFALAREALFSPWIWLVGVSGFALLISYALALRSLELSTAYAAVTSLALIGVLLVSSLTQMEQISTMNGLGVLLIMLGIFFITKF